jgi:hypothetical protein
LQQLGLNGRRWRRSLRRTCVVPLAIVAAGDAPSADQPVCAESMSDTASIFEPDS